MITIFSQPLLVFPAAAFQRKQQERAGVLYNDDFL